MNTLQGERKRREIEKKRQTDLIEEHFIRTTARLGRRGQGALRIPVELLGEQVPLTLRFEPVFEAIFLSFLADDLLLSDERRLRYLRLSCLLLLLPRSLFFLSLLLFFGLLSSFDFFLETDFDRLRCLPFFVISLSSLLLTFSTAFPLLVDCVFDGDWEYITTR